jgi:hypothetical protein
MTGRNFLSEFDRIVAECIADSARASEAVLLGYGATPDEIEAEIRHLTEEAEASAVDSRAAFVDWITGRRDGPAKAKPDAPDAAAKRIGRDVAAEVCGYLDRVTGPLVARIEALERALRERPAPPRDDQAQEER